MASVVGKKKNVVITRGGEADYVGDMEKELGKRSFSDGKKEDRNSQWFVSLFRVYTYDSFH